MSNDQNYFSLSWDAYQNTLCSSFSSLQQNGDFVDMTLAAEGHLVKVHQLIMGVASPYIKQLLKSASCQHPVIFLNNMSYTTLSNILQYIYTGEVTLPEDQLASFFGSAKSLQISGIGSMNIPSGDSIQGQVRVDKRKRVEEVCVPSNAKNISVIDTTDCSLHLSDNIDDDMTTSDKQDTMEILDESETIGIVGDKEEATTSQDNKQQTQLTSNSHAITTNELQYTVSNRGALQLILNRYIYNLFSKGSSSLIRRWRCIDYRDKKCRACTVTDGNVVIKRYQHTYLCNIRVKGNMHVHGCLLTVSVGEAAHLYNTSLECVSKNLLNPPDVKSADAAVFLSLSNSCK